MGDIAEWVYLAEGAKIVGDVTIGEGSSVWYNAVIRGDSNPIVIGENANEYSDEASEMLREGE